MAGVRNFDHVNMVVGLSPGPLCGATRVRRDDRPFRQGSQFLSRKFVHAPSDNGLDGSMGRVGACGDNAAMESFFALLQRNVLDRRRWTTRAETAPGNRDLDRADDRRERQRALGRLTPIEFELLHTPVATAPEIHTPRFS